MGPYPGGQAEYVRVPFADFNALLLPKEGFEDDFILLADIFPTGTENTENFSDCPEYQSDLRYRMAWC